MTKKTTWAARMSAAAGVAAAGALLVTMTTPADAAAPSLPSVPGTSTLNATVDRVQAESSKLSTAAKNKLVATKDHAMGSQIKRVEGVVKNLGTGSVPSVPAPQGLPDLPGLPSLPKLPKLPGGSPGNGGSTNDAPKYGIDVSGHQGNVDWQSYWNQGKRFAYVKSTEGTGYTNPYFAQQYKGSYNVGMKRGAYHFALPNSSSGATQANYFLNHGGGWSRDGKTLPGVVDLEWNPYGSSCYGMSPSSLKSWISSFANTYHAKTSRYPVIYTSTSWWNDCVGGNHGFQNTSPLWVARYNSSPGALPSGWDTYTFWQYSDGPPDQNRFNGSSARLTALANG